LLALAAAALAPNPRPATMTTPTPKTERISDFTAHKWCNTLLSDPTITHISPRQIPDKREGVSNTFFIRTLFADGAVRASLSLYRPGKGKRRHGDTILTSAQSELPRWSRSAEARRQGRKQEITHNPRDAEAAEFLLLVSLGGDVDGGLHRLHGGVTASLLDQAMGWLLTCVYGPTSATVELKVRYRMPVTTPCVLVVRAKIQRESGRWVDTIAWVEDGRDTVFAEGKGSFVLGRVGGAKI
jgi:acyl-coenzyme A thioesterase PaaI-like protein